MNRVYGALFIAVVVAGGIWADEITPTKDSLRVITYNIHHAEGVDGKLDVERIASVLRGVDADVICLQEVDRGMARTGERNLPEEFAKLMEMRVVFEPNLIVAPSGHYGNATLTVMEIVEQENYALPNPHGVEPRGCLRVRVRWGRGAVDILNTHLGLKPDERLAQAKRIHEIMAELRAGNPEGAIVLAGDLNEPSTEPGLRVLLETLTDSSLLIGENERNTVPVKKPIRQIDFILYGPTIKATNARVLRDEVTVLASDHLPYVADFVWKN